MVTSQYHIIRFVLDVAYEDHKMTSDPDWEGWLQTVARMFKGKPPPALLAGLASKGIEMHDLRIKDGERASADREALWLLRRDAGNRRAAEAAAEQRVRAKEAAVRYNNSGYWEEDDTFRGMKTIWEKRLNEYIQQRDAEWAQI